MNRTKIRSLNRRRQTGALGGWIIAILIFGGGMTLAARLGPLYMDHNTMSGLLDKMGDEAGMGIKSNGELKNIIKQRFKLNNIRDFPIDEHIAFERTGKGTEIVMDYEVRIPLMGNLDLIASFDKSVELRD